MSDSISATHQYLLTHFGPLLTLRHLSEVLNGTPNGLRMAITRKTEPFIVALTGTRRQVGRRLSFEARRVAAIIDQVRDASAEGGRPVARRPRHRSRARRRAKRSLRR